MKISVKVSKCQSVNGFTLIEVITAVVLIAIIMIPVAMIVLEYVRSIAYADSQTQGANLARREMGIVNNLSYATLASASFPNYLESNFDLMREVTFAPDSGNAVKKVVVTMYPHGSAERLIELATYVMNIQFGAGSAGGALGNEADSFVSSGGALSRSSLSNVTLQNTRATGNITMTGVIMTSSIDKTLRRITIGGETRFSETVTLPANTPTTIAFQKNFFMNSSMTYSDANGATFTLSSSPRGQSYTVGVIFLFYDNTQSSAYSWTY